MSSLFHLFTETPVDCLTSFTAAKEQDIRTVFDLVSCLFSYLLVNEFEQLSDTCCYLCNVEIGRQKKKKKQLWEQVNGKA